MSPLGLAAEECSCGKDLKQMKVDVQCIQVERLFGLVVHWVGLAVLWVKDVWVLQ